MFPLETATRNPGAPKRGEGRTFRIVVGDDHLLNREGLRLLLGTQPDFEVVGAASSAAEAAERCASLRPDVLVLDSGMPGERGVCAVSDVRAASPGTRILALSERSEGRCLVLNPPHHPGAAPPAEPPCSPATDCLDLAVTQGALGAIRRDASPEELFHAIRQVASGNAWFESGVASRMLERGAGPPRPGSGTPLTGREREVGLLILEGLSNKEIARALGIGEPTVKKHVGHLLAKLGLQDRLQVGLHLARNPLLVRGERNLSSRKRAAPSATT